VGNLYIIESASDLRELVHDESRYQGLLTLEEIYELVAARSDYKRIQKIVESKDCIIQ